MLNSSIFLIPALYLFCLSVFGFFKKRHDIVDVAWGPWFVVWFVSVSNFDTSVSMLLLVMITLWALRLAVHIGSRFVKKSQMDKRYQNMIGGFGPMKALRIFLQVYVLQGLLAAVILAPVLWFEINGFELRMFQMIIGVMIFAFGLLVESIADYQLKKFIKNNSGKVCDTGLWAWSRHPNYFGEVVLWWGIYLLTFSFPSSLLFVFGPLCITFLILKVSGVPMLEKLMIDNPKYKDYIASTPEFWPKKPKN